MVYTLGYNRNMYDSSLKLWQREFTNPETEKKFIIFNGNEEKIQFETK
jgi:hypothetical protein